MTRWLIFYWIGYFVTYPFVVRWTVRDFARNFHGLLPWEERDTAFSILWSAAATFFWPFAILYVPYFVIRWVTARTVHKFFVRWVRAASQ